MQKSVQRLQTEAQNVHEVHARLFGSKVGKNVSNIDVSFNNQDEWQIDSQELTKKQTLKANEIMPLQRGNQISKKKSKLHDRSMSDEDFNYGKGGMNDDPDANF